MIKAIIMDVDGVIVGNKSGVNFPLPHKDILEILKEIRIKGIPVVLCTAKFNLAIQGIIKQAELNNPHITDGGALIIDPIDDVIVKKHVLDKNVVKKSLTDFLEKNIYVEIYTPTTYYIQGTQTSKFTDKRSQVLQTEPTIVESLVTVAEKEDIIKIICFASDEKGMPQIEEVIKPFKNSFSFVWSHHPYTMPAQACVVTAPNVSKAKAAKDVAKSLGITFDEILGVGDTAGDWNFMQLCKYVATLNNGDSKIKELVRTKGEGNFIIASHIEENGIVDILKYFSLIKE